MREHSLSPPYMADIDGIRLVPQPNTATVNTTNRPKPSKEGENRLLLVPDHIESNYNGNLIVYPYQP